MNKDHKLIPYRKYIVSYCKLGDRKECGQPGTLVQGTVI